jgi:transcriptional regulator with XRE-family HTH domain
MTGDELRSMRLLSCLTQREAAARLGISERQLSRLETGASKISKTLTKLISSGVLSTP